MPHRARGRGPRAAASFLARSSRTRLDVLHDLVPHLRPLRRRVPKVVPARILDEASTRGGGEPSARVDADQRVVLAVQHERRHLQPAQRRRMLGGAPPLPLDDGERLPRAAEAVPVDAAAIKVGGVNLDRLSGELRASLRVRLVRLNQLPVPRARREVLVLGHARVGRREGRGAERADEGAVGGRRRRRRRLANPLRSHDEREGAAACRVPRGDDLRDDAAHRRAKDVRPLHAIVVEHADSVVGEVVERVGAHSASVGSRPRLRVLAGDCRQRGGDRIWQRRVEVLREARVAVVERDDTQAGTLEPLRAMPPPRHGGAVPHEEQDRIGRAAVPGGVLDAHTIYESGDRGREERGERERQHTNSGSPS
mmetsp:Transcript_39826/g.132771  ORF Transcript_39826/g.132771 Transcript_39826/m.132771 type:complete len:367 (-) Transcript_39826:4-1104(-)